MHIPEKKYKWLIFPIENYVREFDGKFLLSAVAAERGWGTILAYKGQIRHNLPDINGVTIEINMSNSERVNNYLNHGWRVCAWDEEGLIYDNADEYAHFRLNDEALISHDLIFMWGENQRKDILSHINGIENKLILTGNPRFDLLRPDLREFYAPSVSLLRSKFGKYILINTTFKYVNHYFGKDYILTDLRKSGRIATEEQELDQIAREKHQELIMHAFINMLPVISAHFPEHKIIIRPAPSENFDTWRSTAKELPNVLIIHEGDPIPWMLGAEAVVHNSSTTGVQAYLLGRPVIAYMPVQSDKYDLYLPNALSYKAQDIDQLVALIGEFTTNLDFIDQKVEQEKKVVTRKYIEGMQGAWASDRIMDELEKLDIEPQILNNTYFSAINKNVDQPLKILAQSKNWLKNFFMGKNPVILPEKEKNWEAYTRHRFPTLSFNKLQSDLKRLQEITGRFSNVSISLTDNNLVCVYPSEN